MHVTLQEGQQAMKRFYVTEKKCGWLVKPGGEHNLVACTIGAWGPVLS
jgi:hypothetical protein